MKATRRLAILCCLLVLAACTTAAEVTSSKSMALPAPFDRSTPLPVVDALPAIDAVVWGDCDEQEAPWQCASIEVPLDYRRVTELGTVSIAITRRPAADEPHRIGSLVLNPGGPGGSGVDLAWGYASLFPAALLDRFDLVGFDPRGVSRSTPVDCGDLERSFRVVERDCVARSGDLLPYVGTQNAARDMEQLRKALGDAQLTYLGISAGRLSRGDSPHR